MTGAIQILSAEYALGIRGDALAPDLTDGSFAVFDPCIGAPRAGDIAAIWFRDRSEPAVMRLLTAVPPIGTTEDFEPVLIVHATPGKVQAIPVGDIRCVHRFARIAPATEVQEQPT